MRPPASAEAELQQAWRQLDGEQHGGGMPHRGRWCLSFSQIRRAQDPVPRMTGVGRAPVGNVGERGIWPWGLPVRAAAAGCGYGRCVWTSDPQWTMPDEGYADGDGSDV